MDLSWLRRELRLETQGRQFIDGQSQRGHGVVGGRVLELERELVVRAWGA